MGDVALCSVLDCETARYCRGWCEIHYRRWKKHGDPLMTLRPTLGQKDPYIRNGYVVLTLPNHPLADSRGRVLEHRAIAWDAGLFTDPALHVHHINEDRLDKRLENLEVLTPGEHIRQHNITRCQRRKEEAWVY